MCLKKVQAQCSQGRTIFRGATARLNYIQRFGGEGTHEKKSRTEHIQTFTEGTTFSRKPPLEDTFKKIAAARALKTNCE